jgi:hypothetical protein
MAISPSSNGALTHSRRWYRGFHSAKFIRDPNALAGQITGVIMKRSCRSVTINIGISRNLTESSPSNNPIQNIFTTIVIKPIRAPSNIENLISKNIINTRESTNA